MPNHAIIVSHGQPSAPRPAELALADLAARVQSLLPDWSVTSATLANPGRLDSVMTDCPEAPVIYPFFMARGWFVTQMLPNRLKAYDYRMTAPLGLDPDLPLVARALLEREAQTRGWTPGQTDVLIAAHGSARGHKAAEAANGFTASLQGLTGFKSLTTGFVEQTPFLSQAVQSMRTRSLCLPFFAQSSDHVRKDIPGALATAPHQVVQLPAIGALPQTPTLIARALETSRI